VQGGAVIADAEAQPQPSGHNTEAQVEAAAAAEGAAARAKESLLNAAARARRAAPEETEAEKLLKEERDILHKITQKAALQSVKERAMVRPRHRPCAHVQQRRHVFEPCVVELPSLGLKCVGLPSRTHQVR
jgi:hypothetical protein